MNIALVVDASASLDGAPIESARQACATVVDALDDGDTLAIVTFGSQPKIVVESSIISAETRAAAKKKIEGIRADGTTDLAGGLRVGIEQARARFQNEGINRIVLVGDGVPNDPAQVPSLADQARGLRIPVTMLGLGPDYDETLMSQIAQRSGGTFHFVEDATGVAKVFKEQIARMERLAARNAFVDITPGPGVFVDEAIGLSEQRVGRALRVSIGDLSEGQSRDAVLKVRLTGKKRNDAKVELVDAVLHYSLPSNGSALQASKFVAVKATADANAIKDGVVVEIERQATRLRVADNIVKAIAMARGGDLLGARKLLDATTKLATEGGKKFQDADLEAKVKEIANLKKTLASLAPPPAPVLGAGGMNFPRPKSKFEASPASAADSLRVRAAHGAAVKEIQGD